MRAAAVTVLLGIAALTILVGSCVWAWTTDDFWRPIPLYPAVVAAGVLAALAIYAHSKRRLKAVALGAGVTIVTLVGTAVITLARWEI